MHEQADRPLTQLRGLREATWPAVSLSDVARRMGRSKSYVSLIERGKRPLTDEVGREYLEALADCRDAAKRRLSAA